MSQYPRAQAQIIGLVESMIAGFTEHPDFFPHADTASLQAAHDEFMAASNALTDAESAVAMAAAEKLEKQKQLEIAMKSNIRYATADCSANPDRLGFIGWGARRAPSPIDAPAQPTHLKVIAQGDGMVFLKWNKSSRRLGGLVRMYVIERRLMQNNGDGWEFITTSYNPEIWLKSQQAGVKMEYRVKASNAAGESCATNTVSVVL
jgi:hypothetical protein